MIRFLLTFLTASFVVSSVVSAQTTESYIVLERYSRKVLLADNSEKKRPVAGLSHMVTAKVVMDWTKAAGVSSSTLVTIPNHQFHTATQNPLGLQPGDRLSVRDAIYSTLLGEDCVATTALANHVGLELMQRRQLVGNPIGVFVTEMNNLSRSLGMTRTRFILPCGADNLTRNSFSTASDFARLSVVLASDSGFGFYAKQKSRNLKIYKAGGGEVTLAVTNNNQLLKSGLKVIGFKSSFSPAAGQCVAELANKDFYVEKLASGKSKVTPVQLVVVVLGSARAEELTKNLIPQGWSQYDNWRNQGYMSSADRREFLKLPASL